MIATPTACRHCSRTPLVSHGEAWCLVHGTISETAYGRNLGDERIPVVERLDGCQYAATCAQCPFSYCALDSEDEEQGRLL